MALHPRRLQSGKRLGREEEGQAAESFSQRVFFALVSKQSTDNFKPLFTALLECQQLYQQLLISSWWMFG